MKKILCVVIAGVMLAAMSVNVFAFEGAYYESRNGRVSKEIEHSVNWSGNWFCTDGEWYCLDGDGYLLHDCWVGNYYLDDRGCMATNFETPDGYYVGADGQWIPGYDTQSTEKHYSFINIQGTGYSMDNGIFTIYGDGDQYCYNGKSHAYGYFYDRTMQFQITENTTFTSNLQPVAREDFINEADRMRGISDIEIISVQGRLINVNIYRSWD